MPISINGSGSITGLSAGGLPDGSITAADLAAGAARSNFGAGAVLQVIQGVKSDSDTISASANTWYDTGLEATITPSSSASKILIMANGHGQPRYNESPNSPVSFRVTKNGSSITGKFGFNTAGANSENQASSNAIIHLDSPATTSALTYKIQILIPSTNTLYLNRSYANTGLEMRIILQEIAG
jgi:hypothetical protein